MENRVINVGVVKKVAKALQHLRPKVAFVGGAIISLYVDDPSADEVVQQGGKARVFFPQISLIERHADER